MSPRTRAGGDSEGILGSSRPTGSAVSSWAEYVQRQLDALGWNNVTLSRASNIDRSLIGRWINDGTQPTIDSIRAVARAFGRDIREALVAAGVFTEQEMKVAAPSAPDMRLLNDEELLDEVRRRMARWATDGEPGEGGPGEVTEVPEQAGVDVGETAEEGSDEGLLPDPGQPTTKPRGNRRQEPEAEDRIRTGR